MAINDYLHSIIQTGPKLYYIAAMKATEEQLKIIHSSGNLRINAVAGSGKTTTLVEYARTRPQGSAILYLAFNKSVKDEAIRKFAESGVNNVTVETAHSLAFRSIVRRHGYQVGFHSPVDIATAVFKTEHPSTDQLITATHIQRFAALFCNSPAKKVQELDYREHVKEPEELKRVKASYDLLELNTRQYLAAMHRREIPISHDFYLKLFQLENPQLRYHYILFDEAQDASPVMVEIVKAQEHATRIIVGDSHQQIYRWRHAVNSMELFPFEELSLTKSFRFPQLIADLAVETVKTKRHFMPQPEIKLIGTEKDPKSKIETKAVIGRTNISLLAEAIALVKSNGEGFRIYFEGHIRSYLFGDDEGSLSDILNLYNEKREYIKSPIVANCSDTTELKEYAKRMGDSQMVKVIELVNKHGKALPSLLALLRKRHLDSEDRHKADCYFSTVHRCKGLEYDEVFLCSDFSHEKMICAVKDDPERTPGDLAEEVNLLYVAITRAKVRLHLAKECIPESFNHPLRNHIRLNKDKDSMDKLAEAASSGRPRFPKAKPKASGAYWSRPDENYLISQYRKGVSLHDIALKLQRSRSALRKRLQHLNLYEG